MSSVILARMIHINKVWSNNKPWDRDEELRMRLEDAGWRYAVLIGVVDPDEIDCPDTTRAEDRRAYSHLIHEWDGWPLWDDNDATTFVAEVSGASREISAAWLDFDWNNRGEA